MNPAIRPYILLNHAVSLDGKISTENRDPVRFTSRNDRKLMDDIRASVDAVLIGAETLRAEAPPVRIQSTAAKDERTRNGKPAHPTSIILTRTMQFPVDGRYWDDDEVERIIITTDEPSRSTFEPFEGKAEIIRAGDKNIDMKELCSILYSRGISRLLVEGGGEVNMGFWMDGLVDEVYLTLCPVLIGGRKAPTSADGVGFSANDIRRLTLLESKQLGQELFLRYRVKPSANDGPTSKF